MEKTYNLNGCSLHVSFEPKIMRVAKPDELTRYLSSDIDSRTEILVNLIKKDYALQYNQPLKISNKSIAIEIWGHMFASQVASVIKKRLPFKIAIRFANFIISRSDKIDCGESEVDTNRFIWDLLAPFKSIILWFLPNGKLANK